MQRVIALIHGGWRPISRGIIESTVEAMVQNFNTDPKDVEAFIGPGIGYCHYEVDFEVASLITGQKYPPSGAKLKVSLAAEIEKRLLALGVGVVSRDKPSCTWCDMTTVEGNYQYKWFSHRRDKVDPIEAQMAVFGMI